MTEEELSDCRKVDKARELVLLEEDRERAVDTIEDIAAQTRRLVHKDRHWRGILGHIDAKIRKLEKEDGE